jgi:hypothetical protein
MDAQGINERLIRIEDNLAKLQVAVAKIEQNQANFSKLVTIFGGSTATAVVGILVKMFQS